MIFFNLAVITVYDYLFCNIQICSKKNYIQYLREILLHSFVFTFLSTLDKCERLNTSNKSIKNK